MGLEFSTLGRSFERTRSDMVSVEGPGARFRLICVVVRIPWLKRCMRQVPSSCSRDRFALPQLCPGVCQHRTWLLWFTSFVARRRFFPFCSPSFPSVLFSCLLLLFLFVSLVCLSVCRSVCVLVGWLVGWLLGLLVCFVVVVGSVPSRSVPFSCFASCFWLSGLPLFVVGGRDAVYRLCGSTGGDASAPDSWGVRRGAAGLRRARVVRSFSESSGEASSAGQE